MDKKPLIVVSLFAVVLLVLGSLSNVVGYQSVKSTVDDSPLFKTRTQRATNQQQKGITSMYLGIGKGNFLQFPIRDNRTEQLKKAIDIISKMDEKTFDNFINLFINHLIRNNIYLNYDRKEVTLYIQQLKNEKENNPHPPTYYTCFGYRPNCIIEGLFNLLCGLLWAIVWLLIAIFYPNFTVECGSPT